MKSTAFILMIICLCCSSLQLSSQVFDPSTGSTHYGNGTSYHPHGGNNGAVTTKDNGAVIDCATFPDLCRGLLEEADRDKNPKPTPQTPDDGSDDGDKKDKKKKKKPKKQSYNSGDLPQEDVEAIAEFYKIYKSRSGVWFKQSGGEWIRVNDHSAHTAKLIGYITKK